MESGVGRPLVGILRLQGGDSLSAEIIQSLRSACLTKLVQRS